MKLPNCVVCGEECIPLADYDMPTCVKCDDAMALVLERAQFRIPADPEGMPEVTGCGTPAGYLTHYRLCEEPCEPCTHFWDVAQLNIHAWHQARRMKESADGLSKLRDANASKPRRTRPVLSAVHGVGSGGVVRADPRPSDGARDEVRKEEVPVGIVKPNRLYEPSKMPGQTDIFDQIRDQVAALG